MDCFPIMTVIYNEGDVMLFRLITTWVFNLIDTVATVYFYNNYDGTELNPISAAMLTQSPALFIAFKLIVMTIAVAFMWWKRNWKFCKVTSWILFVEYLLVAIYYLVITILLYN
jgi:hypothetical protein